MRTMLLRWGRMGLVLVGVLVVQLAVVSDLMLLGAMGDLMLLLAIAAASLTGPNRGALYGFAVGITYDLMLTTPFGLSALVYALVGYAVGVASGWFLEPRRWSLLLLTGATSVTAVVTTVGVGLFLGLAYPVDDILRIAVVVAVWNCLLILPARRIMEWVIGSEEQDEFWMALP